jgi:hypothetical protein
MGGHGESKMTTLIRMPTSEVSSREQASEPKSAPWPTMAARSQVPLRER